MIRPFFFIGDRLFDIRSLFWGCIVAIDRTKQSASGIGGYVYTLEFETEEHGHRIVDEMPEVPEDELLAWFDTLIIEPMPRRRSPLVKRPWPYPLTNLVHEHHRAA